MLRRWVILLALFVLGCAPHGASDDEPASTIHETVSADSFLDKLTAGYQGWFAAAGDGSPIGGWSHWSGQMPAAGKVTFELYPDTREYDPGDLYDTSFAPLGDGRPARLFSSYGERVVDTHFRWMEEAGIDGVGLQRFLTELGDPRFAEMRNQVTRNVRAAAERHGRIFYVEYDISGAHEATLVDDLQRDWTETMRGALDVTSSPQYAHQGGRPVVYLWGFGFRDRPGTPAQAAAVIDWLEAQGCFVAVGVPYQWRTEDGAAKPGFLGAFAKADLIQPWAVGALATDADVDAQFGDVIKKDIAWAQQHGVAYQRVIFPGFAWSNWNGGSRNAIPRRAGRFFWKQAVATKRAGVSAFIAMFDEYDEGTAIAKAAESAAQIPGDQYFLTLDADGTAVSSDFYLRLAGAATRMFHGEAPVTYAVPVPAFPEGTPPSGGGTPPSGGGAPSDAAVPAQAPYAGSAPSYDAARAEVIVGRLYEAVLGREADPGGMGAYAPLVQSGELAVVVSALVTSGEFEARRASLTTTVFAGELYLDLLDREPDPGGLAATVDAIRKGLAAERIVAMVTSDEYASKNP